MKKLAKIFALGLFLAGLMSVMFGTNYYSINVLPSSGSMYDTWWVTTTAATHIESHGYVDAGSIGGGMNALHNGTPVIQYSVSGSNWAYQYASASVSNLPAGDYYLTHGANGMPGIYYNFATLVTW